MTAPASSSRAERLAARLRERCAPLIHALHSDADMPTLECLPEKILPLCRQLHADAELDFAQLSDLCGMDYSTYGQADWRTEETTRTGFSRGVETAPHREAAEEDGRPRYAVVYHLLSLRHNTRLRLRCPTHGDPPRIESVVPVWSSALWYEREAFDLYGILFEGHPDLRRLLTDYGFLGHPFRKDFPLEGRQEVRYDPRQGRVIYQPVTIRNRVLVPRVIRRDHRYLGRDGDEEESAGRA